MRYRRAYRLYERDVRKRRWFIVGTGLLAAAAAAAAVLAIHGHAHTGTGATARPGSSSVQSAPGQTSSGTPVSDAQALGIAAGGSLPELSQQALNAHMAGTAASGATWVRFDFDWSQIQPASASSYDWAPYDSIVAAAAAQHLQILGIIDFTPAWARAHGCDSKQCPPADDAAYANFAAALAKRYAPKNVHAWEIWNEPNNPQFWQPGDNPKSYVGLLSAAYSALHVADSRAYVLTGGLSPQPDDATAMSPVHFLTELYNNGAKGHFDAVADHPYTFPLSPASKADDAWTQMAAASHSLRALMVAQGDAGKRIWITEFGAPTGGPGPVATLANPNLAAQPYVVDQGLQAKILSDAMAAYRTYSWAGPFFYYSYQDAGTDPSTNENFFGLLTANGTPKQAYSVFQQAAAALKR